FSSVSLSPKLVLWSLDRKSSSLETCMASDHFAVHILAADQEQLADQFCTRGIERFTGVQTTEGRGGLPLIDGCAAVFQCRTVHRYDGGDHIIFVGEVLDYTHGCREPLAFHGGAYAKVVKRSDVSEGAECDMGVDLM